MAELGPWYAARCIAFSPLVNLGCPTSLFRFMLNLQLTTSLTRGQCWAGRGTPSVHEQRPAINPPGTQRWRREVDTNFVKAQETLIAQQFSEQQNHKLWRKKAKNPMIHPEAFQKSHAISKAAWHGSIAEPGPGLPVEAEGARLEASLQGGLLSR